jgi:acyl-ACP thioesterase
MEPVAVYTINRMPSSSEMDFSRRMRISTAFDYFQDIAGLHADNLGAGIGTLLRDYNIAWILMRVRIEVNRMAGLDEPLLVDSWPQPPNTLYDRDYVIRTEDGEVLVNAISTWVVMELTTHELAKGRVFDYTYPIEPTARAIDHKLRQLKAPEPPVKVMEHSVSYSDLDYNRHVNNARYVNLIMDSYGMDHHEAYEVAAIEVNYINEIGMGDSLVISRASYPKADDGAADGLKDYIELTSAGDGRTAVKAAIEFRKRK